MSTTVADILDSVAMRKGENASPDNATEKKRRIKFINQAYMALFQKMAYWFTEKTSVFDKTIASQEAYDLPTDYREMIEVRIDDVARYPMSQTEAFDYYQYPPISALYSGYYANKFYFIFADEIHFIPIPDTTSITNNIQYRYYYWPTALTATTDSIVIPDAYVECLSAYCVARLAKVSGKRGSAADDFDEFNEIVREMNRENITRQINSLGGR